MELEKSKDWKAIDKHGDEMTNIKNKTEDFFSTSEVRKFRLNWHSVVVVVHLISKQE